MTVGIPKRQTNLGEKPRDAARRSDRRSRFAVTTMAHPFDRRTFLGTGSAAIASMLSGGGGLRGADDATSILFRPAGRSAFRQARASRLQEARGEASGGHSPDPELLADHGGAQCRSVLDGCEVVARERASFVLQVGDLVEGLCGSQELAEKQNREAVDFVRHARLGVPFLFTKGNHDVTGDGAVAAFQDVFHPFLKEQSSAFKGGGQGTSANYSIEHRDAQFCFFDAYDKTSLEWLESVLAKRTARNCFVVISSSRRSLWGEVDVARVCVRERCRPPREAAGVAWAGERDRPG